jgi:hypothetical protein
MEAEEWINLMWYLPLYEGIRRWVSDDSEMESKPKARKWLA